MEWLKMLGVRHPEKRRVWRQSVWGQGAEEGVCELL